MSNHEDSWERLDTEFDHCLLDMKPYVLKHPDKKGRQYCAIWIKKLCSKGGPWIGPLPITQNQEPSKHYLLTCPFTLMNQ
uniref:DUF4485 domain-containing protein n=1 Tax=Knipowitschia caucasica TaxID=637954 RepID=A0AAV2KGZ3_KNICA